MYLAYIQQLRALSIAMVVAWHVTAVFNWPQGSDALKFLDIVLVDSSTVLIFVAGYIFQHLLAKYNVKKYYVSKLKYIITPYFLISLPAILYFVFIVHREAAKTWLGFYDQSIPMQILSFYATGIHLSPMWFIPVISLFYLISPLLVMADKTKWFYWLLPIFFIISFIVWRGLPLNSFIHFFAAYVFGMFCSRYKTQLGALLKKTYVLPLLATICLALSILAFNETDGYNISAYIYTQKIFLAVFLIGIFEKFSSDNIPKAVELIANTSFGIFLIHPYILFIAKFLSRKANFFLNAEYVRLQGNILLHVVATILVLAASAALVRLIQYFLPEKSWVLVGKESKGKAPKKSLAANASVNL